MLKTKKLAANIAVPLLVGGVSAFISRSGMQNFEKLAKPPLSPPAALFPAVWTILFVLMGIASYLVAVSDADEKQTDNALTVYALQLGVNFLWSIFFFKFGWYLFSFFWLILLWAMILYTIILFSRISKKAAYLLIPYIVWVSFAGYLNLGVALLNR
ncbi:MAG: tryptophan-rich sensory protein [Firmicutes bacterium]|nr:tryptophan-rich sensory protein [Bacillota bacterium]